MILKTLSKAFEFGISTFMSVGLGRTKENYSVKRQSNIYVRMQNSTVIATSTSLVKVDPV